MITDLTLITLKEADYFAENQNTAKPNNAQKTANDIAKDILPKYSEGGKEATLQKSITDRDWYEETGSDRCTLVALCVAALGFFIAGVTILP